MNFLKQSEDKTLGCFVPLVPTAIPVKIAKVYYQFLAAKTARTDFVFPHSFMELL
jgi:hypothetical protein